MSDDSKETEHDELDETRVLIENGHRLYDCKVAASAIGFANPEDLQRLVEAHEHRYDGRKLLVKIDDREMVVEDAAKHFAQAQPHLLTIAARMEQRRQAEKAATIDARQSLVMGYDQNHRQLEQKRRRQEQMRKMDPQKLATMRDDELIALGYRNNMEQEEK